jgi:hypothetical protein
MAYGFASRARSTFPPDGVIEINPDMSFPRQSRPQATATVWPQRLLMLQVVHQTPFAPVHFHPDPDGCWSGGTAIVEFIGYLATIICTAQDCRATIGIVDGGGNFGPCSLNGVWYDTNAFTGEQPERYLPLELK